MKKKTNGRDTSMLLPNNIRGVLKQTTKIVTLKKSGRYFIAISTRLICSFVPYNWIGQKVTLTRIL